MKRYNIIIVCISMLFVCACDNERLSSPIQQQPMTFSAVTESDNTTKTSLGTKEGGIYRTLWNEGDTFDVMCDNAGPYSFTLSDGAGTACGKFQGEGMQASRYTALYPQGMNPNIAGNTISFALPQTQQYKENSFGDDAFPMIAVSNGTDFVFKNLCSVLKLSLKGEYEVRSIVFVPNDTTLKVSGCSTVSLNFTDEPELVMGKDAYGSVQLDCGDKLLNSEQATDFYIVIPSQTYKDGFTVEINTTNWISPLFTKSTNKNFTAERSMLYGMAEFELEDPGGSTGDPERDALIAFYNATDGDHWTRNDNWCTDKPLGAWYGVTVYKGHVVYLRLASNNVNGEIPDNICNLTQLSWLQLGGNPIVGGFPSSLTELSNLENFSMSKTDLKGKALPEDICKLGKLRELYLTGCNIGGSIPKSIGQLPNLETLWLADNNICGSLPSSIGDCKNLISLQLSNNKLEGTIPPSITNLQNLEELGLYGNQLYGTFPEELTSMKNLYDISLGDNLFEGPIPESYRDWPLFKGQWGYFIFNNNITENEFYEYGLKAPDFHVEDLDGNKIDNSIFQQYKYTILINCPRWAKEYWFPSLLETYNKYKELGLNIIQWNTSGNREDAQNWAAQCDWTFLYSPRNADETSGVKWNNISALNHYDCNDYPGGYIPEVTLVDSTGTVIKNTGFHYDCDYFLSFVAKCFSNIKNE